MTSVYYIAVWPIVQLLHKIRFVKENTYKDMRKKYYCSKMTLFAAVHNFLARGKVKRYFNLHTKNSKMVIYTCLTGGYDALLIPDFINSECDYICFTDDKGLIAKGYFGPWKIEPLHFSELNNSKNNRWHKMHPHLLFPDYQNSLYIDSNVNFRTGKVFEYIRSVPKKCFIAVPRHACRDCIYEEADFVVSHNIDTAENVNPLIEKYHNENFPEHFGMGENNVIFRRHHNSRCVQLMEEWWDIFNRYSKRDQLTLFYLFWKEKINFVFFGPYSFKKDHKNFRIYKHKG